MSAARREVLRLYRAILRRGDDLTYTDKDFFRRTVKKEFRRWSREKDPEEINQQLEKARWFLASDLGGMV